MAVASIDKSSVAVVLGAAQIPGVIQKSSVAVVLAEDFPVTAVRNLYIGETPITDIQFGSTPISAVYYGSTLIWER